MASIGSNVGYRRRVFWVLFSASVGLMGAFAACTDSYGGDSPYGAGTGPNGGGGAGGNTGAAGGLIGDGGSCEVTCSNDLKKVVNCLGTVIRECTPEQGCANAECIADPCEAAEKSKSSYGCDYWALKTAQRPQADGSCFAAFVANTWGHAVQLTVKRNGVVLPVADFTYIPEGQGPAPSISYTRYNPETGLAIGQVAVMFLSRSSAGGGSIDCPVSGALDEETGIFGTGIGSAFHITTDYPVVAYQIDPYGGGQLAFTSATLLLPTSAWDTNYIAVNAYKTSEVFPNGNPSLNIVAQEDATKVTISPTVKIVGNGGSVPETALGRTATYTLDAGQFLQIMQSEELTGSPILSDKPIGVFGASSCMTVPADLLDCDSAQQQLAPVKALGSEYVGVRYRGRQGGTDEAPPWRLVGAADGTTLVWTPSAPPGAPQTLRQGELVEFSAAGPFTVHSQDKNHPFYIGAYMTGGKAYGSEGDPDWVNVIPPSQFLDYYVFLTDPTYPETSLVVVRTPSKVDGTYADVTLDCRGVISGWQRVGDYEYTRVDLVTGAFMGVEGCGNGRHEMSSPLPFGVTVWGWGAVQQSQNVSYAYPAGAGFQPINEVVVSPVPR